MAIFRQGPPKAPMGCVECTGYKNRNFRPISRFISEMIEDMRMGIGNSTQAFEWHCFHSFSDLEWLSEIFNDTEQRSVSLRQLSFLLRADFMTQDIDVHIRRIDKCEPWGQGLAWMKILACQALSSGPLKFSSIEQPPGNPAFWTLW